MQRTTEYMSLDSMTGINATSFFLTGKLDAWARAVGKREGKRREEREEKRGERKETKGERRKRGREGKGEERKGREGEREKEREKDQGWEEEKQPPQASSFSF